MPSLFHRQIGSVDRDYLFVEEVLECFVECFPFLVELAQLANVMLLPVVQQSENALLSRFLLVVGRFEVGTDIADAAVG